MARQCQLTGKKTTRGKTYSIRGIAKKKKGIGLNVTSTTKRRFRPNMIKKRFWCPEEKRFITLRVSADGMRTIDKHGVTAALREMRKRGQKV